MKVYLWGNLPDGIEAPETIDINPCKFVFVKEGTGEQDAQEVHNAGDYVMLRNLMAWASDRSLTLEEAANKWSKWLDEFFSSLDPSRPPKAIMIDHVRYKDRRSDKSIEWLTEKIVEPLQKTFPEAVVSLYGHPSGRTLWGKERFAEPDHETVYWVRGIGHWAREGQETLAGFMAKIASIKLAGYNEVALWFDGRVDPVKKYWDQMFWCLHMLRGYNLEMIIPEPSSGLPWRPPIQQPGEPFLEYLKRLAEYHEKVSK